MTQLSQAFGKKFDKDSLRIKSFEYGGHTFKVKIPLTSEYESIIQQANVPNEELLEKYYGSLSKEFLEKKKDFASNGKVEFLENDILVEKKSLREAAKNKVLTEQRILALMKLLVPEEKDFDMNSITYEMVEELFPFSVQLEVIDLISDSISPNYKDQRGK
jgi:hypothetical protein